MEPEEEIREPVQIIRPLRIGHEFAPNYSTDELFRGVCHIVPGQKMQKATSGRDAQLELNRRRAAASRKKFDDNREAIYEMLKTAGKKAVAHHFHIGKNNFYKYLSDDRYAR